MAVTTPSNKRTLRSLSLEPTEEEEDYKVTFSSTPSIPTKKPRMAKSPEKSERSLSTAIVNELKSHFDKKSDETQENFRDYMAGVEKKVDKNTENFREIKEAIGRLERGSTSSLTSVGSMDNAIEDARPVQSLDFNRADDPLIRRGKYDFSRRSLRVWPVEEEATLSS